MATTPVYKKRRLISLLPAWNQTDDLKNFFGSTVDQLFQPGTSEAISGYIGRHPPSVDPHDFYVGEPTPERAAYQLESGMVSYDATGTLTEVLTYPDFVGYLQTTGADVSDHQRLFETEYWAWAPPINYDMLINHRNYYWFGDENGFADLPILTLTVPMTDAIGDGSTTTYPLPASINTVPQSAETPTVYVNGQTVDFTIVGDNVVLATAPATNDVITVTRVPDLASIIVGQVTVDVSDLNSHGVIALSSGMRIKIRDALAIIDVWDYLPWDTNQWDTNSTYMVDGIGQSLRLTADDNLIRGIEAQYVTIDRSSVDSNLWSLHNLWVHKDTFAWYKGSFLTPLTERQALRPIVEFIRDIVLYKPQVWSESIDPLFMLYDLNCVPLNDVTHYPDSNFTGSRIFGFSSGSTATDSILHRSLVIDPNGYITFTNTTVTERYSYTGGAITGLYTYATAE